MIRVGGMVIHSTFIESTEDHDEERISKDHVLKSSQFPVQLQRCSCSLLPWIVTNVVWQRYLFVVSIQVWCINGNSSDVGLLKVLNIYSHLFSSYRSGLFFGISLFQSCNKCS